MLLQTTLFLTLVLAAIVLVVATLLRESAPRESLRALLDLWRVGAGAVFLACAAGLVAATDESTGSLLAGREMGGVESEGEPAVVRAPRPLMNEPVLIESGFGADALAER